MILMYLCGDGYRDESVYMIEKGRRRMVNAYGSNSLFLAYLSIGTDLVALIECCINLYIYVSFYHNKKKKKKKTNKTKKKKKN